MLGLFPVKKSGWARRSMLWMRDRSNHAECDGIKMVGVVPGSTSAGLFGTSSASFSVCSAVGVGVGVVGPASAAVAGA